MEDNEKDKVVEEVTEEVQPELEESKQTSKRVTKQPKVVLSPEQIASRQLAHDIKVAKFLAGGKF